MCMFMTVFVCYVNESSQIAVQVTTTIPHHVILQFVDCLLFVVSEGVVLRVLLERTEGCKDGRESKRMSFVKPYFIPSLFY